MFCWLQWMPILSSFYIFLNLIFRKDFLTHVKDAASDWLFQIENFAACSGIHNQLMRFLLNCNLPHLILSSALYLIKFLYLMELWMLLLLFCWDIVVHIRQFKWFIYILQSTAIIIIDKLFLLIYDVWSRWVIFSRWCVFLRFRLDQYVIILNIIYYLSIFHAIGL